MPNVYTKFCQQCHKKFESTRNDARFCEPRCAAQWARDNGQYRERYHAEKEEETRKECAHCGHGFWFNDYAARSGKRVPQYCSNKCRQAAYRARKGPAAGYTGNWDDARNDKTNGEKPKQEQARKKQEQAKKDTSQKQEQAKKDTSQKQEQAKKDTSQDSRWSSKDPRVVLGVTYQSTKEEVKKAWKTLLRKYHPDVCKDANATYICQMINAAWDKLERAL